MLLVGISLAGGMLMVGGDRYYCAYAVNARYNTFLNQRLKSPADNR